MILQRCPWPGTDPLYLAYHDHEWGSPVYDRNRLFEKICLEGQQAGLSWITVLRKREHYRAAFHHFDPDAIARMDSADIDQLLHNPGLIRHRGKLDAIVKNARALLTMEAQGEDFVAFLWQYATAPGSHGPRRHITDIPAHTPESQALSKALKKRGFSFVGTTTCYAFMQSMGLVNDHLDHCFCQAPCDEAPRKNWTNISDAL